MFTTIVQKWNAFKTDWKEYKRLCHVAARAWHKLQDVRYKITYVHVGDEEKKTNSCIDAQFVKVPSVTLQDDLFGQSCSQLMPLRYNEYCPYFKRRANKQVDPCGQKDCPCYRENCEYATASAEYANAVAHRRGFNLWRSLKSKIK